MTKIWLMSDLHYEILPAGATDSFPQVDADVLIVAGDYHRATRAVTHARQQFPEIPLVMICGNHEHYRTRVSVSAGIKRMQADAAADRATTGRLTHVLENEVLELTIGDERLRIVAGTLWTDFELFGDFETHARYAENAMNDYNYVLGDKVGDDELRPAETCVWHRQTRSFVEKELREPFDGRTVVITHHLPSLRSVAARYRSDPLTSAFASHCDDLLALGADLWLHGHTHDSCDYLAGRTRVVCNPRGYASHYGRLLRPENPRFVPDLVLEI